MVMVMVMAMDVDGRCPIQDGEQALGMLGMADVDVTMNTIIMIIMTFVYRLIAMIGFKFLYRGKTFKEIWNE